MDMTNQLAIAISNDVAEQGRENSRPQKAVQLFLKLFAPDERDFKIASRRNRKLRFANEPDKLETYHKLTAAINQGKGQRRHRDAA